MDPQNIESKRCKNCNGRGWITCPRCNGKDKHIPGVTCSNCFGKSKTICIDCDGTGEMKTL